MELTEHTGREGREMREKRGRGERREGGRGRSSIEMARLRKLFAVRYKH